MLSLSHRSLSSLLLGASVAASATASGCCYLPSADPAAPAPSLAVAPAVAPMAAPAAGTQSVTLGAGFLPDPTTVATIAGGSVPASSMATPDVYCAGNIGMVPNVTLTTTTPIYGLRVLVRSTADTTLAVRLADGRVLCNDDGGGYPNPAVEADFPAGVHQIYVGAFHAGEVPAATVGFTTNPALLNEQLP